MANFERTAPDGRENFERDNPFAALSAAIVRRMVELNIHEMERLGVSDNDWERYHDLVEKEPVLPDWLDFEKDMVHDGPLLGAQRFRLIRCMTPTGEGRPGTEDFSRYLWGLSTEESVTLGFKQLDVATYRAGRAEEWCVWTTPDSPPYAVNLADARYVGMLPEELTVASRVKQAFGADAVPLLSVQEIAALTSAVASTPAVLHPATQF